MTVAELLEWVESAPADRRAEAAYALARALLVAPAIGDRPVMESAITILLDGAASDVRMAIARALAGSEDAPRHVIATLAADQAAVAGEVLARSPLFIDAELIELLAAVPPSLQIAIASRPEVSAMVSAAIGEGGTREVCRALLTNAGADIAAATHHILAHRFGDDGEIREALLARQDLPPAVHQALVKRVADALGRLVVARAWLAEPRAAAVTREATERATVTIAASAQGGGLPALVEHLRASGQLTTALLLRAVAAGYVEFFEVALARLADVPAERVASLARARRTSGLRAVYAKAGLPAVAFDAFAAAMEAWSEIHAEGAAEDYCSAARRVSHTLLSRYAHAADGEGSEVATMLRRLAAEQAREAAYEYARASAAAA